MKQLQQQLQLADKMDVKNELETKCRIMAEHLIEKQALNETLNSEKAALQLQLEKTQQRVKEVELVARITPTAAVVHRRSNQPHEDPLGMFKFGHLSHIAWLISKNLLKTRKTIQHQYHVSSLKNFFTV